MLTYFLLFGLVLQIASSDLFTSTADMRVLLAAEQHIPEVINSYIASETARLDNLKRCC